MTGGFAINAAVRLRNRLKAEGIIAAPGAPDGLTARLIEEARFDAIGHGLVFGGEGHGGCAAVLKRDGTLAKAGRAMMSYAEFSAPVDLPRFRALEESCG